MGEKRMFNTDEQWVCASLINTLTTLDPGPPNLAHSHIPETYEQHCRGPPSRHTFSAGNPNLTKGLKRH